MTSVTCLSTDVGIGLAAENFSGGRRTASMTSSVVGGEKHSKAAPGRTWLNDAGGASLVFNRALATFSSRSTTTLQISEAIAAKCSDTTVVTAVTASLTSEKSREIVFE